MKLSNNLIQLLDKKRGLEFEKKLAEDRLRFIDFVFPNRLITNSPYISESDIKETNQKNIEAKEYIGDKILEISCKIEILNKEIVNLYLDKTT